MLNRFFRSVSGHIRILCLLLLLQMFNLSRAQDSCISRNWVWGLNSAVFIYQGDLTSSSAGSWKTTRTGIAFTAARALNGRSSLKYSLTFGSLEGDDAKYRQDQLFRAYRKFYFRSNFAELTASHTIFLFHHDRKPHRFNPYLSAGAGAALLFNTERRTGETDFSYFSPDLKTKLSEDSLHGFPPLILAVPVGAGFNWRLKDGLYFNMEALYRFTSSDYLDGFSRAGNNFKNDFFYGISAGIHFTLGKKKRSSVSPVRTGPVPSVTGIPETKKNPGFPDRDRDGIADSIDHCPDTRGTIGKLGCPEEPVIMQPDKKSNSESREENPEPVVFKSRNYLVYFEYDRSGLTGQAFNSLNEVLQVLRGDSSLKVILRGHTDLAGSVESNYKLSLQRASVCADYLSSYAIDRKRIKLEAYSKLQPVAGPDDERSQWKNRRVEVIVYRQ